MRRRNLLIGLLVSVLLYAGFVFAQKPVRNISAHKHPNLAAAQRLIGQASAKIDAAQQANEFDMGGHAAKAKQLLAQASDELKQAALADNANK